MTKRKQVGWPAGCHPPTRVSPWRSAPPHPLATPLSNMIVLISDDYAYDGTDADVISVGPAGDVTTGRNVSRLASTGEVRHDGEETGAGEGLGATGAGEGRGATGAGEGQEAARAGEGSGATEEGAGGVPEDVVVLCCRYHQAWNQYRCVLPDDQVLPRFACRFG